MKGKWRLSLVMLLLLVSFVAAAEEEEIEEGRELVESKISCDTANDEQLESIGEYYMEIMHPGVLHDAMHEVMGIEEGTEEHKQFHITLAKRMYCGESTNYNGMMGYGMMGMMYNVGSWGGYSFWSFWNITSLLFMALVFALIFWGVYILAVKKKR